MRPETKNVIGVVGDSSAVVGFIFRLVLTVTVVWVIGPAAGVAALVVNVCMVGYAVLGAISVVCGIIYRRCKVS